MTWAWVKLQIVKTQRHCFVPSSCILNTSRLLSFSWFSLMLIIYSICSEIITNKQNLMNTFAQLMLSSLSLMHPGGAPWKLDGSCQLWQEVQCVFSTTLLWWRYLQGTARCSHQSHFQFSFSYIWASIISSNRHRKASSCWVFYHTMVKLNPIWSLRLKARSP